MNRPYATPRTSKIKQTPPRSFAFFFFTIFWRVSVIVKELCGSRYTSGDCVCPTIYGSAILNSSVFTYKSTVNANVFEVVVFKKKKINHFKVINNNINNNKYINQLTMTKFSRQLYDFKGENIQIIYPWTLRKFYDRPQ